jgi:ADP-ribose pyrophosphatase YjhB (NUDIX family)
MTDFRFNIRVYGIFINHKNEVLLADEFCHHTLMTKFPGGGLEFGEGTIECLKREIKEELNQEISHIEHFYTTDFFQEAQFFTRTQLVSIYYKATLANENAVITSNHPFDFTPVEGAMSFRWEPLSQLTPEHLTFPIDKKVITLLKEYLKK